MKTDFWLPTRAFLLPVMTSPLYPNQSSAYSVNASLEAPAASLPWL